MQRDRFHAGAAGPGGLGPGRAGGWYRFVTPARQAARHRLRVLSVQPEGPGIASIVITGRHLDELRAEAGQFLRWRFLTRGLWWTSLPYSLSAPPRPDRLRITAKELGGHSQALAALRPGTRVLAEGPYGALTAGARRQRKVLLIAGPERPGQGGYLTRAGRVLRGCRIGRMVEVLL